jgi:hypothetical protein
MTHSASRLQIAKDDFRRVHDQLISLSGGKDRATNVYHKICAQAKGQTRVDCSSGTNTALMQLCSTTFKDESDPTRCEERMMLNAQIYALAKLYMDLDPEALFVHNSQVNFWFWGSSTCLTVCQTRSISCKVHFSAFVHTLYSITMQEIKV